MRVEAHEPAASVAVQCGALLHLASSKCCCQFAPETNTGQLQGRAGWMLDAPAVLGTREGRPFRSTCRMTGGEFMGRYAGGAHGVRVKGIQTGIDGAQPGQGRCREGMRAHDVCAVRGAGLGTAGTGRSAAAGDGTAHARLGGGCKMGRAFDQRVGIMHENGPPGAWGGESSACVTRMVLCSPGEE